MINYFPSLLFELGVVRGKMDEINSCRKAAKQEVSMQLRKMI